jgi:hypothetical protein
MPTIAEGSGNQSQVASTLDQGTEALSKSQFVSFTRYQRQVLSPDGSIFWTATAEQMLVEGSFHYATDRDQSEDQTIGINHVIFTALSEITQFNQITPTQMWIGTWPISGGPPLRVAFSSRDNYYIEADIWHYRGFAIYPAMETQILDSAGDLPQGPIVSNSLPIWLTSGTFAGVTVPVYPSFLIPDNAAPPYIAAHIDPDKTEALGAFPQAGPLSEGSAQANTGVSPIFILPVSQLCRDEVKLTLYGFNSQLAAQYYHSLIEGSLNETLPFGFANRPVVKDVKRTQPEIATIAMKKELTIEANYYQESANVIARRLLLEAILSSVTFLGGAPALIAGAGAIGPISGMAEVEFWW